MIAPNQSNTAAHDEPAKAAPGVGSALANVAPATTGDSVPSHPRERDLEQLVRHVLRMFLSEIDTDRPLINGKLAVDEREAAALLGLRYWQLRDLRTSGKIGHHRIVGGRVRYTHTDLTEYLNRNHHRATG